MLNSTDKVNNLEIISLWIVLDTAHSYTTSEIQDYRQSAYHELWL